MRKYLIFNLKRIYVIILGIGERKMFGEIITPTIPMINIRAKNWVSNGGGEFGKERSFVAKCCAFEMYAEIEQYYAKGSWEIVGYVDCTGIEEKIGSSCLAHLQKYMRYLERFADRKYNAIRLLILMEGDYEVAKYLMKVEEEQC